MRLYDLKRGDKFKLIEEPSVPPDCNPNELGTNEIYTYKYVDGMYAPVTNSKGEVAYFAAWTEVEK